MIKENDEFLNFQNDLRNFIEKYIDNNFKAKFFQLNVIVKLFRKQFIQKC
jgi:hypothetical protein